MKTTGKLIIFVFTLWALVVSTYAADISPLFKIKNIAELEVLLAKGADVNAKNEVGDTLLHLAAKAGVKDIVALLLAKGADVNAKGEDKDTPLHRATEAGEKDIVALLLTKGADVNAKNREGRPPLRMAVSIKNKEIAELLLTKGADVNAVDTFGTPLDIAVIGENKDIAELLLNKGADINHKESAGRTALHFAASYPGVKKDIAEWLLAKGADVNAKDEGGATPLHYAVSNGKKDIVELLLAKGADTNADTNALTNYPGTPLDTAMSVNNARSDLVDLLEQPMLIHARRNPRAVLVQMTAQLKVEPCCYRSHNGRRHFIIKLASELKPAPAIPEEARKHFVEGAAIVKAAKNPAQQAIAAQSFTEALKIAPWWGDAYYNLGVAQELAEKYNEAEQAFNFYLLSNPSAAEKREVQDRIYELSAKRKLAGVK